MKTKLLYFSALALLCAGMIGCTVAIARSFPDEQQSSEQQSDEQQSNEQYLFTNVDDFELGKWYRFYIDKSNPESEAYIVLNLVAGESDFNGGFTEPGSDVEVDLSKVTIGISTDFTDEGYIYWNDTTRLVVDAEVNAGENWFEIYLDESVFTGMGDNETKPSIWFELTRCTECLEIVTSGGGYVVKLDK